MDSPQLLKRCLLIVIFSLIACPSYAQFQLAPDAHQQFFTNTGLVAANYRLCTFAAGSTTPLNAYSDNIGTALPNPIVLNAAGRPQTGGGAETGLYLSTANYKFILYNSGTGNTCNGTQVGTLIWTQDNISVNTSLTVGAVQGCDAYFNTTNTSYSLALTACANALPSTGGTADARKLGTLSTAWNSDAFSGITKPIDYFCGPPTITVSATATIVNTVHLVPSAGCNFFVNNGITLTVNASVDGSVLPTFSGPGIVNGTFPNQLVVQASLANPGIWYGTSGGKNVTNLAADPNTGILQMQPVGNGMTSSLHAQVTSGTLPVGTLSEFVITRTPGQAFGGNYSRYSFSSIAGGGTPPTVPNVDGLFIEAGGTSQSNSQLSTPWLVSIGIENPASTFTSYEPFRFLTGSDTGNVGFGVMSVGGTARNIIQIYAPQLSSAGTSDGSSLEYFGYSFDTMQHAVNWRENVHPTTNAGASFWRLQNRVDLAAFVDMIDCSSGGQCLFGASADMTVNDYATGQGKLFGLGGVTASNAVINSSMIRMQSFGGAGGFHVIGSDASGNGRGEPIIFAMCTASACINGLNGGSQIVQMGLRDTAGGGVLIGNTGTVPSTGQLLTMGGVAVNNATMTGAMNTSGTFYAVGLNAEGSTKSAMCHDDVTMQVLTNPAATCTVSSLRFKDWLEDLTCAEAHRIVMAAKPGIFRDKDRVDGPRYGFAAEEMAAIEPQLVYYESDKKTPRSIDYERYTAVLTKEFQCRP